MKLLTGNDLKSGDVIWWNGLDWSRFVAEAADVSDDGEGILHREEAAQRVNAPYIVDAEQTDNGPRPAHIKERIRALGPTVRPDLSLKPADSDAADWVI